MDEQPERSPARMQPEPLSSLLREMSGAARRIIHDQTALARVEARIASRGVVRMVMGGVMFGVGWIAVCGAACVLLSAWLTTAWWVVIIGGAHCVIGGALALWGRNLMEIVSSDPPSASEAMVEPPSNGSHRSHSHE